MNIGAIVNIVMPEVRRLTPTERCHIAREAGEFLASGGDIFARGSIRQAEIDGAISRVSYGLACAIAEAGADVYFRDALGIKPPTTVPADVKHHGSHYTPRRLVAPIVRRTMIPYLQVWFGEGLTAQQIAGKLMSFRLCDPACGSGAFLLEGCRFIAAKVVQQWRRAKTLGDIAASYGDPELCARRIIAQRCLYGVDKDPQAVMLARLSLQLFTTAPQSSPVLVAHNIKCGDGLVGLDLDNIRSFHWSRGDEPHPVLSALVDDALAKVAKARQAIADSAFDQYPGLVQWVA